MRLKIKHIVVIMMFLYVLSVYLIYTAVRHTAKYSDSRNSARGDSLKGKMETEITHNIHLAKTTIGYDKNENKDFQLDFFQDDGCKVENKCNKYYGHFTAVIPHSLYIYSVHYDARYQQSDYLRFIAIGDKHIRQRISDFVCQFSTSLPGEESVKSELTVYEMCENHNKFYGGYILSCTVPKNHIPCRVKLTHKSDNSHVDFPVKHPGNKPIHKYSTCVPPLYGDVSPESIIEFVELNNILGVDHIHFYIYKDSENHPTGNMSVPFMKILQHYSEKGSVSFEYWPLPVTRRSIWYYGQSISIADCLYKHAGRTEYLTFQDLDEYIIPREQYLTLDEIVSVLWQKDTAGLKFSSVFFTDENKRSGELLTLQSLQRTTSISDVRSKCMVKPELIFEQGIHHISKPLDGYSDRKVPHEVALLHHYRKCNKDFGMRCEQQEKDMTILKYHSELKNRVNAVLKSFEAS